MNTSSKPQFNLNQYNESKSKVHNKLPVLCLSPISSHEPSTAPTLLNANLVSSPKIGSPMSGPFALIKKFKLLNNNVHLRIETSSTDQGYQQMAYVSSYAH